MKVAEDEQRPSIADPVEGAGDRAQQSIAA
jgi:hypothetical protein